MHSDPLADLDSHLSARERRLASEEEARSKAERSRQNALALHQQAAHDALKSAILPELGKIHERLGQRGLQTKATLRKISGLDSLIGDATQTEAVLELQAGPSGSEKHSIRFVTKATETSWSIRCLVESHDHALLNAFRGETWPGTDLPELPAWASAKVIEFIKSALP